MTSSILTGFMAVITMIFGAFAGCNESGLSFGFPEGNNTAPSTSNVTIAIEPATNTFGVINAPFGLNVVEVSQGARVTWVNNDSRTHSIVSSGGDWDAGTVGPGQSVSHVFNEAGTFVYSCRVHLEERTGTIRVVAPPEPFAFPSPSPF